MSIKVQSFQGLSDIQISARRAVVTITIPDTKALMPSTFEYDHLLHPATLDACFHGLLASGFNEYLDSKAVAIVSGTISTSSLDEELLLTARRLLELNEFQSQLIFLEVLATSSLVSSRVFALASTRYGRL
jgi:hypothetical protein